GSPTRPGGVWPAVSPGTGSDAAGPLGGVGVVGSVGGVAGGAEPMRASGPGVSGASVIVRQPPYTRPSAAKKDSHSPTFRLFPSRTNVNVIDDATVPRSSRTSPALSPNRRLPLAFVPATATATTAIAASTKSTTSKTFHALAPANQWKNSNTKRAMPDAAAIVSPGVMRAGSKSRPPAVATEHPLVDLPGHGGS